MELRMQKYKYDCWVAAMYNLLQKNEILMDYKELEKSLKTTKLWGTIPQNLDIFIQNIFQNSHPIFGILLVDGKKFYNDDEDYGHYVNIISQKDEKYEFFDPYDGKKHFFTLEEIKYLSQNVLVWKTTRYNGIIFWNTFDIDLK